MKVVSAQTQAALEMMALSPAQAVGTREISEIRSELKAIAIAGRVPGPRPDGVSVSEQTLSAGVVVRLYKPPATAGAQPPVVFVHGGGWALCDIDTHHELACQLCSDTGCLVASVDYRLAPEHGYPVPLHDCILAARWLAEAAASLGCSPGGIVVAGDSSGGNLAAALALAAAADPTVPRVLLQVLIYPVLDCNFSTPSYQAFGDGRFGLSTRQMQWYWDAYAPGQERHEPLASPGRASQLTGVAPAFIGVGEFDPLRDEARAYATALAAAGVPVELHDYAGGFHGFYSFRGVLDIASDAAADVARAIHAAAASLSGKDGQPE